MPRFFLPEEAFCTDTVVINGEDASHISRSLRMKTGDALTLCDMNNTDYFCVIESIDSDSVTVRVREKGRSKSEMPCRTVLYQAVAKGEKMDVIVQKAVELGVSEIIPVLTKRTVVKLEDKKKEQKKLERWQAIAEAAAKQSGRGIIPKVREAVKFADAVKQAGELDEALIPYELAEGMDEARERIRSLHGKNTIGIFIGPEGGFAEEEIAVAAKAGIHPITLGKRILRTETAGLCILSVIMFELEQ